MEIVRLYRLSCLDQERLRSGIKIVLAWPRVLMTGFNAKWIHASSACTAVQLSMTLQGDPRDMRVWSFEIDSDYAVFAHRIMRSPKLVVILTLLRTWMPWLIELIVQHVTGLNQDLQELWSGSPSRSSLSDIPNVTWNIGSPITATRMLPHFLDPGTDYDETDPWLLHFLCYAISHNWWNGLTANASKLLGSDQQAYVPDGDFWLCDPCLPDIYAVVYPSDAAMRFSYHKPKARFLTGATRYFYYEVKQVELLSILQSLCQAQSSKRSQCMHLELASHGFYTALTDLVLQYI